MPPPSFVRVNEIVSVQHPATKNDQSSSTTAGSESTPVPPETILFLSWADASARHIEKYTSLYRQLYPGARIILVETGMVQFFLRPARARRRLVAPVVDMLRDAAADSLLVHIMSNAGAQQWCVINQARSDADGRTLANAPTVIDSAPGRAHLKQTWAAIAGSLPRAHAPRLVLSLVLGVFLGMLFASKYVMPGTNSLDVVRQQLNEHAPTVAGARRCYIYSEQDRLVGWEDVQDHAKEAEKKGWCVELVRSQAGVHVGHLKENPQRYREAIEGTWLPRSKL
ncbi:DUF829 domain protein (PaxU) [Cordyceps militaris CM01]|uniref:DUF829 domain protein (PaxU) n=1 Tax=Cordyceps militaris (strain CM01) TaxID=983644 RepID=G3JRL3_CORMM|nr:DUF829 domain protein (PaxU) [Cordyceps militaris CM01]EGX88616.1 DUF829 domain protein (PaxU) [Cordyceps militaris CM01]